MEKGSLMFDKKLGIISLIFMINLWQSLLNAQSCNTGYVDINGTCYWEKDIQFLEDIATLNGSGTAPLDIGHQQWSNGRMTYFHVYNFSINGPLPSSVGNLTEVNYFSMYGSDVTAPLPDSLIHLTKLENFYLENNQLSGEFPPLIYRMSNIRHFSLYYNQLTGTLPDSIQYMPNLRQLNVSYNQFSGIIPNWIGRMSNLDNLNLSGNEFTGTIPDSLQYLSNLSSLSLGNNQLSGTLPSFIWDFNNLYSLYLYDNEFTGIIPSDIKDLANLHYFNVGNNKLTGTIPDEITELQELRSFEIYSNELTGSLPDSMAKLTKLYSLNMSDNKFIGQIPEAIGALSELEYLRINGNTFTGTLPDTLKNLSKLRSLSVEYNQLTGEIPSWLGRLKELHYLHFQGNQFSGNIPDSIVNLSNLYGIFFHENQLTGAIPESIGRLTNLEYLELNNNQMSGELPDSIMYLKKLRYINLRDNQFSGRIPDSLASLPELYGIDLRNNQFKGRVSQAFCNMPNLNWMDVNNNRLCTPYPTCTNKIYFGTQDTSECHFPWMMETTPINPAPGQMVTFNGLNFHPSGDTTKITFNQNGTSHSGLVFESPSSSTELFVRLPEELSAGNCTTTVTVIGDSLLTSDQFILSLDTQLAHPIINNMFMDSNGTHRSTNQAVAGDSIYISGYGVDFEDWSVIFLKNGKSIVGDTLRTRSDSVIKVAPEVLVPTGLGTGWAKAIVSVQVGSQSAADTLDFHYQDNYAFVDIGNTAGPWIGNEEYPYKLIQMGIDSVSTDGTVLVKNGTYKENIDLKGKPLKVGSLYMTTADSSHIPNTIIDGDKNGTVVTFKTNEDSTTSFTGFTIINGLSSNGGGIYFDNASPVISHMRILNNTSQENGGGIYCMNSVPILTNIVIAKNKAPKGGGIYLGEAGTKPKMNHLTIAENDGAGIYLELSGNASTGNPSLTNSVVWGNSGSSIEFASTGSAFGLDVSYTTIQGGEDSINTKGNGVVNWGQGSVNEDPLFESGYYLGNYSHAIGGGDPNGSANIDIYGRVRPNPAGSDVDMGAIEHPRALPLLKTANVFDGLGITDTSLWNDATKLSAHWERFENNSAVNYEYAIGTFEENNIVDWQFVGTDTFITATGLDLQHDSTYYFHVKGVDERNRESEVSTSDGILIDIVAPSIVDTKVSWTSPNPLMGDILIEYTTSEWADTGEVSMNANLDNQYGFEYKFNDNERFEVRVEGPFTSGDSIVINVKGYKDRAGNAAVDSSLSYFVGFIGDFNLDGQIDGGDLSVMINGWQNKIMDFELAPTTGILPNLKPNVDGKFDIYDAAVFTRMWHWFRENNSIKADEVLASFGDEIDIIVSNGKMSMETINGAQTIELMINYPLELVQLNIESLQSTSDAMVLSKIDTLLGMGWVTKGAMDSTHVLDLNIPYSPELDEDVDVNITYIIYGRHGEELSAGTQVVRLKSIPKAFALHQNYPNPFNPVTTINIDVPKETHMQLVVYDILGREVATLIDGIMSAGYQSMTWNTKSISGIPVGAGVYFYQVRTADFVDTKKMVILK